MAFEEEKRRRKALEEKLDSFKTEVVYCFLLLWIVSLHGNCDFNLEPTTYKHGTDYISPPQLRSCGEDTYSVPRLYVHVRTCSPFVSLSRPHLFTIFLYLGYGNASNEILFPGGRVKVKVKVAIF